MINDVPHCETHHEHSGSVADVISGMPDDDLLYDLSELYKVFGDSTRIKILYSLFHGELCVCDISSVVGLGSSAVSHQLRILKNAKLVKYRKVGKSVIYSLSDDHVKTILGQGMDHITE